MLLGLDLGTTNIKALVTDLSGKCLARGASPVRLLHRGPDGVEQDLEEIWTATLLAIRQALQSVEPAVIQAIGVSSQGGALQLTDAHRRPLGRVVSWLDQRGRSFNAALTAELGEEWFVQRIGRTGAGLAIGQLLRLRHESPSQMAAPNRVGFVGDLMVQRLCGQAGHDGTSCGLTALYDPARHRYAPDVLQRLGVAPEQLPPLFSPRTPVGGLVPAVARETGLHAGIPVSAAIHDQYAAALATGAVRAGTAMIGTGTAWVLLAVTESLSRPVSDRGFCCHHLAENLWGQILSMVNGGSALAWALKLTGHDHRSPEEIDGILESVPSGSDGLQCWPFFAPGGTTGLAGDMTGRLSGLRLAHGPGHVIRAVLEGLGCELARHIGVLRAAGIPVERLVLGGAGAASRVTPRILAALTGLPLACAGPEGGSPLGAAILARGLIEPTIPLAVLAGQMSPVGQPVEPGPTAAFYRQQLEQYLESLPPSLPT